jgi:dipeptidase E
VKLFLSSIAAKVLPLLEEVFSLNPSITKVAFVPTAGDVYENPSFVEDDRKKLVELGYQVKIVRLQGKSSSQLESEVQECSVIFVAGGNTFFLMQEVKQSGFDKIISERVKHGAIYVGSSAGAVIVGASTDLVKSLDDPAKAPHLKSYDGIHLIPEAILPHAGNPKYTERYQKITDEYSSKYRIIQLTDTQVYVNDNGKAQILDVNRIREW